MGPIGVSVRGSGVGGFTSGLGGADSGERLVTGSFGSSFGGFGPGPSANTAIAPSKNTTLSHIADLWVECAFMGVLLLRLVSRTIRFYVKCLCRRNCFRGGRLMKYFARELHI